MERYQDAAIILYAAACGTCCDMLFFFAAVQSKDHTPKRCHQSSYKWHGEARQPTSKTKFLCRVELFSSCALTIVNSLPMFRMEEVKRCSNLGLSDGSFSILTSKNTNPERDQLKEKGLYFFATPFLLLHWIMIYRLLRAIEERLGNRWPERFGKWCNGYLECWQLLQVREKQNKSCQHGNLAIASHEHKTNRC